jgi:hypothetical protein
MVEITDRREIGFKLAAWRRTLECDIGFTLPDLAAAVDVIEQLLDTCCEVVAECEPEADGTVVDEPDGGGTVILSPAQEDCRTWLRLVRDWQPEPEET